MFANSKAGYSLTGHNTLAINCIAADTFINIRAKTQLVELIQQGRGESFLVLGGGSNLLFEKAYIEQPVLWINIPGIEQLEEQADTVIVRAMAGENWHRFVLWCLRRDYGGLENLSLIPGNVGAAPVQNIGAYGVEIKDTLHQVEALNVKDGSIRQFAAEECAFAYRDSLFKSTQRGQWVILSVSFRLSRRHHRLQLEYGDVRRSLIKSGVNDPTIHDVSAAVINIRQHRLPDPKQLPNAGSFFKNPIVSPRAFEQLKAANPDLPRFRLTDRRVKIPAGWLIEKCGWKGKRFGNCAVYQQHALVLINNGNATGAEILELARRIQASVLRRFKLRLDLEVSISSDAVFTRR